MNSAALLLSPAVQRAIKSEAFRVWSPLRRFGYEIDDLRQEFALHLFLRLDQYEESRACLATFVRHACRNKALQLLEKETAAKRNAAGIPHSLSAPLGDDGGRTELCATITEDAYAVRMGRRSVVAVEAMVLKLDTESAIKRLAPDLAKAAHLLAEDEPIADIARKLGVSRSTAYRWFGRIRRALTDAGLGVYAEAKEAA